MTDYAWDPEAILALCAAAEDHLLEFFEVCCPSSYSYWHNSYALLLFLQAKSKFEREAELVSEVMRLKSMVADLLSHKAKHELGKEKKKKQKMTK